VWIGLLHCGDAGNCISRCRCSLQIGGAEGTNKQNCEAVIYMPARASLMGLNLEWRAEATATRRLIYEGATGDPIEGSVEIQPVGQNWRSDPHSPQRSRAVAPGRGPQATRIAAGIGPQGAGHKTHSLRRPRRVYHQGGCDGDALREIGWLWSKRAIGVHILYQRTHNFGSTLLSPRVCAGSAIQRPVH
jgi:hypothetical protein